MKARRDKKGQCDIPVESQEQMHDCLINFVVVMCYKMQNAERGQ